MRGDKQVKWWVESDGEACGGGVGVGVAPPPRNHHPIRQDPQGPACTVAARIF